ncbi:MAG TPA: hypothetical protein VKB18_05470 [Gemmatimonadota bacterium]|nr:hypothetical protein [Gemmatimonadota bacterium]
MPTDRPSRVSERDIEILRRMTPAEKIAVMNSLVRQAYALAAAGVRLRDPDLPEDQVEAEARALVAGDRA